MSNLKMRDALITARGVLVLEGYAEDNLAVVKIDEALAQQPAAGVELTDEEIMGVATKTKTAEPGRYGYILPFAFARAVIAAHEAKKNGGVRDE